MAAWENREAFSSSWTPGRRGLPRSDPGGKEPCRRFDARASGNPFGAEPRLAKALLLYNANPVFGTPDNWRVSEAVEKVPFIASFGSFIDETSILADMILPDHSPLESWLDDAPPSGSARTVASLAAPAMSPLHNTRAMPDVLLDVAQQLGGDIAKSLPWKTYDEALKVAFEQLRQQKGSVTATDPDDFWQKVQDQGGWWSAEEKPLPVSAGKLVGGPAKNAAPQFDGDPAQFPFHLLPYASQMWYDGSLANLPWMQEAPDPISSVMWGSWVEINTQTAAKLGIAQGDLLEVASQHGTLQAPAFVTPGIAPDCVAMPIGQGHTNFTRYAKDRGANPISILAPLTDSETGSLAWAATRVKISRIGKGNMVLFGGSLRKRRRKQSTDRKAQLMSHQWGMVIDLDRCTGCEACVVACHAENNISTVGEDQAAIGRAKHWIRVERYYEGEFPEVKAKFMPVLCQQCDAAPCEPVCPTYASYHTQEGLNGQVYNRCIGTRYCANACPYTVRFFNFYNPVWDKPLQLQLNPDVSVRSVGVMEKCTFCIQRIKAGEIQAEAEKREVKDGEIQPACVQSCPTRAMVFGDLNDPQSEVSRMARSNRATKLLAELGTLPKVTYLQRESANASKNA